MKISQFWQTFQVGENKCDLVMRGNLDSLADERCLRQLELLFKYNRYNLCIICNLAIYALFRITPNFA